MAERLKSIVSCKEHPMPPVRYVKRKLNNEVLEIAESDEEEECCDVDFDSKRGKIWFYAPVNKQSVLKLHKALNVCNSEIDTCALKQDRFIELYIHSDGGCFFSGMAAMEKIKANAYPVHTLVDGMAASAATFLLMGGKRRYMFSTGYILVHSIRTQVGYVTHKEMGDDMDNTNMLQNDLVEFYKKHTSIPSKCLHKLMNSELYLNSLDSKRMKIIDEIISTA